MSARKILLADDDPDDKQIIKEALDQISSEKDVLVFAENGEQVIDTLQNEFGGEMLPCLIVLDLNMPRMNGTNTLRFLKSNDRYKNIPVIIYSTSINPLEKEKCMSLGAHAYVTKPVSFQESISVAKMFYDFS